jgi:4-alpha-glucanotransferase
MRNPTRTRRPVFLPRSSGILLHVTSLPGPHGCGDLGAEAHRFLEVLAASGQGWWQMLPIGPPGRAPGWSPYDSASAFAGSPWLVSLASMARQGLLLPHELKPPPGLTSRRVNFAATLRYRTTTRGSAPPTPAITTTTPRRVGFRDFPRQNAAAFKPTRAVTLLRFITTPCAPCSPRPPVW